MFDLAVALDDPASDPDAIVEIFATYMERGGHGVTRTQFEAKLHAKRLARFFGTSPDSWMNLQSRYDLEVAKDRGLQRIEQEVCSYESLV